MSQPSDIDKEEENTSVETCQQETLQRIFDAKSSDYKTLLHQKNDVFGETERESLYVHMGPLPPANELEKYEKLLPGSVERCFKNWEEESIHRRQLENIHEKNEHQIRMKELELQERNLANREKDASMNFNMFGKSIQIKGRGQIVSAFLILAAMSPCVVGAFLENRFIFVVGAILACLFVIFLKGAETKSEDKRKDQERKSEPDPLSEEYTITSRL